MKQDQTQLTQHANNIHGCPFIHYTCLHAACSPSITNLDSIDIVPVVGVAGDSNKVPGATGVVVGDSKEVPGATDMPTRSNWCEKKNTGSLMAFASKLWSEQT